MAAAIFCSHNFIAFTGFCFGFFCRFLLRFSGCSLAKLSASVTNSLLFVKKKKKKKTGSLSSHFFFFILHALIFFPSYTVRTC